MIAARLFMLIIKDGPKIAYDIVQAAVKEILMVYGKRKVAELKKLILEKTKRLVNSVTLENLI